MQTVANRLHDALKAQPHRMSLAEVARRARLKAVTVRTYFGDERNPPLDVCMALGRVLGVNGQWLFDGKGPRGEQLVDVDKEIDRVRDVPLIEAVQAGKLTAPGSQIPVQDVPLLAFADLGSGDYFALRVNGSSMDRVSPEGSIIVVNRSDQVLVSGRCYVFAMKGETTYKRWQGGDPAYLDPFSTDAAHKPIFLHKRKDWAVVGRVKRTILDL